MVGPADLVEGLAGVPEGASVDPLALPAGEPPGPAEEWHVGSVCVARWCEDLIWYRAEVTEVLEGNNQIVALFIDYGNSAKVPRADMVTIGGGPGWRWSTSWERTWRPRAAPSSPSTTTGCKCLTPGRGLVYTLHLEGEDCQATVCGGPEQWGGPEGILVADPASRRLVLLDTAGGIARQQLLFDLDIKQPGTLIRCLLSDSSEARRWWSQRMGRASSPPGSRGWRLTTRDSS